MKGSIALLVRGAASVRGAAAVTEGTNPVAEAVAAEADAAGGLSARANAVLSLRDSLNGAGSISSNPTFQSGQGGTVWNAQGGMDGAGAVGSPISDTALDYVWAAIRARAAAQTDAISAVSGSISIAESALGRFGGVGSVSASTYRVTFGTGRSDATGSISANLQVVAALIAKTDGAGGVSANAVPALTNKVQLNAAAGISGRLAPISFASGSSAGTAAFSAPAQVAFRASGLFGSASLGFSYEFTDEFTSANATISGGYRLRANLIAAPIGALAGISGDVVKATPSQEFTDEFTEEFTSGPATWPLAGEIDGSAGVLASITVSEFTNEFTDEFNT